MDKRKFSETIKGYQEPLFAEHYKVLENMKSEDGKLKYDYMTSMYNIATAKVVTHLWTDQSIQEEIRNLYSSIILGQSVSYEDWLHIENNIITKVKHLKIPESIIRNLIQVVPDIGKNIRDWIRYHDEWVFQIDNEYSAVDEIGKIAWTARGKIDYAQTAKNILATQSGLSSHNKYSLACNNCLENEIRFFAPFIVSLHYLNSITLEERPMVHFWSIHITGYTVDLLSSHCEDYSNFRRYYEQNMSFNEYIMRILIGNAIVDDCLHEVPTRYVWNKLTDQERSKILIPFMKINFFQDLMYALLSSLNFEYQREIFRKYFSAILHSIHSDWLWEGLFFPTALHVVDILDESSYMEFLIMINEMKSKYCRGRNEYDRFKCLMKLILKKCSANFKDLHFKGWKISTKKHVVCFSWERDADVIQLIFRDSKEKKNIIFAEDGIEECIRLIKNGKWCLVELFAAYCLLSEEDIIKLKQRLVRSYSGYEIAEHFIKSSVERVEYFMNWAMISEEEKKLFRMKCFKFLDTKLEFLEPNNEESFEELEKYIKWCASNNEIIVGELKSKIPKLYFNTVVRELLLEDMYEFLNKILKWCFSNDEKQIEAFKSEFCKDSYITRYHRRCLIYSLTMKDRTLQLLDKFVSWCFSNEVVQTFKTKVVYRHEFGRCNCVRHVYGNKKGCAICVVYYLCSSICVDFILNREYEFADKFVNWCLESHQEVAQFKRALMLSRDMKFVLEQHIDGTNIISMDDLLLLIWWLNPSKETVAEFKMLFPSKICPFQFHALLDTFAGGFQ